MSNFKAEFKITMHYAAIDIDDAHSIEWMVKEAFDESDIDGKIEILSIEPDL